MKTQPVDALFFSLHPGRHYRIRGPVDWEFEEEFRSLGPHALDRRRVIVGRVDPLRARLFQVPFACVPLLLFADESIEDDDATVGPLFRKILQDAATAEGREVIL